MCMECTKDLITTFVFSRVTATFGVPFIERTIFFGEGIFCTHISLVYTYT